MSDTHGNIAFMRKATDRMIDEFRVEAIIHLGDDLADAHKLDTRGVSLFAVPGMYEVAWGDPAIPHRIIEEFGGVKFLLSHSPIRTSFDNPSDINPARAKSRFGVDVLLHGHNHTYRAVESVDHLIVISPGHLKSEEDRGSMATFAIIGVLHPKISVEIYDLKGPLVMSSSFFLDVKLV